MKFCWNNGDESFSIAKVEELYEFIFLMDPFLILNYRPLYLMPSYCVSDILEETDSIVGPL